MKYGLIEIYTGTGKGKTTAALGLAVRARGAGLRVALVQFLKGRETAELAPLRSLGVEILRAGTEKFVFEMNPDEKAACKRAQQALFDEAVRRAPFFDVVILDEVFGALATDMLDAERLRRFLHDKPVGTELILTGRDAPADLLAAADYVSDIHSVRHPYDRGVQSRRGIEF